ncbi:MAG: hypothetical protein LBB08_00725, partial [Rickettsiales bacterium]|nr:hypothetical protein [Rickettsiales bacterium]
MPNEDNIARRISRIANLEELQRLYGDTFGKSGVMTARLKSMRDLPDAERALLNKEKEDLQAAFKERRAALEYESMMAELAVEKIDATRSPPPESGGRLHPLTRAFLEISAAWRALGYEFA